MNRRWNLYKKLLSYIFAVSVAVLICAVALPTEAKAASESDLTFTLDSNGEGYVVSSCSKTATGGLVIPATHNGKPVIYIGDLAFFNCTKLTSVTIPDSVTIIGNQAFSFCSNLIYITIGNSVTSISSSAFLCSNPSHIFYRGTAEQWKTFGFGSIEGLRGTFCHYETTSEVVTTKELCTVSVHHCGLCNSDFCAPRNDGQHDFANGSCTVCSVPQGIRYSISRDGSVTIDGYTDCETNLVLPNTIEGLPVTTIEAGAFSDRTDLTSVTIPDSVTSISHFAFENCTGLTSITIGNGVTFIGDGVFRGCSLLKEVIYHGSKDQKTAISMGSDNQVLLAATWINPSCTHSYDNVCDSSCNLCDDIRTPPHQYSTNWSKNDAYHWYECYICGNRKDLASHTPGAAASSCTVCGTNNQNTTQPADPTEPSTEPSTNPTEPSAEPTEPNTQPTEPSAQPTEPSTHPTESTPHNSEPVTNPTIPSTAPVVPDNSGKETGSSATWIVITAAVVLLGGGAAAGVILWKKKH